MEKESLDVNTKPVIPNPGSLCCGANSCSAIFEPLSAIFEPLFKMFNCHPCPVNH